MRKRAAMQPRPIPLFSHKIPAAAAYEKVSTWTDSNRTKAKALADSHGNRVPAGGWPKMTGTEENKQRQAIREIDSVLRHPNLQATFGRDTWGNRVLKYRAPEAHQEGVAGVTNTGRGAMYTKDGLAHLISNDREDDVLAAARAKNTAKKQSRETRKAEKNAS